MNFLGTISVHPVLPQRLSRLRELAHNLWWSWTPAAVELFEEVGGPLWHETHHNPVHLLSIVSQEQFDKLAASKEFVKRYEAVLEAFDQYMSPSKTWFSKNHPELKGKTFAYFSAEFGLHECLPIYSGGLGVLSGDHCKSASDLGVPLVGVGLLYNQGYFTQLINSEGWQEAVYPRLDFSRLPITPARGAHGEDVVIAVDLPDRVIHAKVWRVQVGRVPVYLLDTDIEWNSHDDRRLSSQLYGGDRDMRISQEIILGIGGVIALKALGHDPMVFHMNEGHSAFLGLARIRDLMRSHNLSFAAALEAVSASTVFTTHTPVPAGHDSFSHDMMDRYFSRYMAMTGIPRNRLLALGGPGSFSMTVLALNTSRHANGVSKLHGEVSRELWRDMWEGFADQEMPIGHITNGVHVRSWLAPKMGELYSKHIGTQWEDHAMDTASWQPVRSIPADKMWSAHYALKEKMLAHVRDRLQMRLRRLGRSNTSIRDVEQLLDPHALTIGFARRFATYKRATLLFSDPDRLARLLTDPKRPVQLIFAGKAHPADEPGKEFIRRIYELSQDPDFAKHVIIVEGYDINLARHLVSGVDVWLNNPRRPLEACGTSGQKAAINGVINFSVLDGWWDEGYNGENGWTIGEARRYADTDDQDRADAASMYDTLEQEIIPLYYTRDAKGTPLGWIDKMKESIASCGPQFNSDRMVADYTRQLYVPAQTQGERLRADKFSDARALAEWKDRIRTLWHQLHLEAQVPKVSEVAVGEKIEFDATVHLGNLNQKDVALELFVAPVQNGQLGAAQVIAMASQKGGNGAVRYKAEFVPSSNGNYAFGIRAVPEHPKLGNRKEMGLVRWA